MHGIITIVLDNYKWLMSFSALLEQVNHGSLQISDIYAFRYLYIYGVLISNTNVNGTIFGTMQV